MSIYVRKYMVKLLVLLWTYLYPCILIRNKCFVHVHPNHQISKLAALCSSALAWKWPNHLVLLKSYCWTNSFPRYFLGRHSLMADLMIWIFEGQLFSSLRCFLKKDFMTFGHLLKRRNFSSFTSFSRLQTFIAC